MRNFFTGRTEHVIKYLGTIMSGVYALFFGLLLLFLDYKLGNRIFFGSASLEIYQRLIPVVNVLVSIVIGISLTTFSVIFVVMQLASSQFSPRILRHFLANDLRVQHFIALFVGTVALCILPQLASVVYPNQPFLVTLVIGTFLALRALVWSYPSMITYLSVNMNISSITNQIKKEMVQEIHGLYREVWQKGGELLYKRQQATSTAKVFSIVSPFESGYLESVNYVKLEQLLEVIFKKYGVHAVYQKPVVGEYIMKETSVLLMVEAVAFSEDLKKELERLVEVTFLVNVFRSHTQDINFGVRKLVDIAIKAISPAVNDPTTCLNCIDQIGEILKHLSDRQFPSSEARHLMHKNIHINEFNYDEFVDFCFDQIFQWGKNDPTVIKRILRTLRLIVPTVENPFHLKVLLQEVEDMDLLSIYNFENKEGNFSKEKILTIRQELKGFQLKALSQITHLKEKGILHYYTQEHLCCNNEITLVQKETLDFLAMYNINEAL